MVEDRKDDDGGAPLRGEIREGVGDEGWNPNYLRVSEINLLRRVSNRVPFSAEDRICAANAVNDAIRSKSFRRRMAGVKAFTNLEKVNLDEISVLISAKKTVEAATGGKGGTSVVVNVGIVQEALRSPKYLEYLQSRAVGADSDSGDVRQVSEPRPLENGSAPGEDKQRPGPSNGRG
jgi:hypothetical protein